MEKSIYDSPSLYKCNKESDLSTTTTATTTTGTPNENNNASFVSLSFYVLLVLMVSLYA